MKFTSCKMGLLSIILLLCTSNSVLANKQTAKSVSRHAKATAASKLEHENPELNDAERSGCDDDCDDDCQPVKIANLCVGKLGARNITARNIVAKKACAQEFKADHIAADREVVRNLCATNLQAPNASIGNLKVNTFCTNGPVQVGAFQQCGQYRATVVFDAVTTYTLGNTLDFNTIVDDPNNNVHLSPDTYYEAPITGYYIVTLQVDQQNLQGVLPILGTPVTNIQVLVNGVIERQNYNPYLSFHNEQFANLSALIRLNAGDQLTGVYNVFVMQDGIGFVPYAGTVDVSGNGTDQNVSLLSIHYLSSTCPTPPAPCGPITFDCESLIDTHCPSVDCNPCHRK